MQSYHVTIEDEGVVYFNEYFDTLVEASYYAESTAVIGDLVTVRLSNDCLDGYEDIDVVMLYRKKY